MIEKYNYLESNLKDIIASQSFHFKENFDILSYFFYENELRCARGLKKAA